MILQTPGTNISRPLIQVCVGALGNRTTDGTRLGQRGCRDLELPYY